MTDYWREECKALEYQLECAKADRDEYWNQRCDAIARAEKAETAAKHWRCNHDDTVKKLQFATQRPDLQKSRDEWKAKAIELERHAKSDAEDFRAEIAQMRSSMQELADKWNCETQQEKAIYVSDLLSLLYPRETALSVLAQLEIHDAKGKPIAGHIERLRKILEDAK